MMSFRLSRSSEADRILVVSLSNIGDVVLTFPVLDVLHARFPSARIHVVVGPKAAGLLGGIPWIEVVPYDKKMSWQAKGQWLLSLRKFRFDIIVDLRNSMLPFLLNAARVTPPSIAAPRVHMRQKHLQRLDLVLEGMTSGIKRSCVVPEGVVDLSRLLGDKKDYVLVAPGAADRSKRWTEEGFLGVVMHLRERGKEVVLVGDAYDAQTASRIAAKAGAGVIDLCGKTDLRELSAVIDRVVLAITNDSGIMHLASYADKPVVALFGPTDPFFYGPWSGRCVALRKDKSMASISVKDVLAEVDRFL